MRSQEYPNDGKIIADPPGFEPGSEAPEASILSRLYYESKCGTKFSELTDKTMGYIGNGIIPVYLTLLSAFEHNLYVYVLWDLDSHQLP